MISFNQVSVHGVYLARWSLTFIKCGCPRKLSSHLFSGSNVK